MILDKQEDGLSWFVVFSCESPATQADKAPMQRGNSLA
jgi:hypothetical protein